MCGGGGGTPRTEATAESSTSDAGNATLAMARERVKWVEKSKPRASRGQCLKYLFA